MGMDSTYRVPLLDSKVLRLCYAWPSRALTALRMLQRFLLDFKCGRTPVTYPNFITEESYFLFFELKRKLTKFDFADKNVLQLQLHSQAIRRIIANQIIY